MEITGFLTAIVIGAVVGGVGRAVVPGRQHVSLLLTLVIGMVAAFLGTGAATIVGVADTSGIDWIELIMQFSLGAAGVTAVARRREPAQLVDSAAWRG